MDLSLDSSLSEEFVLLGVWTELDGRENNILV